MPPLSPARREALGPAESIVSLLTTWTDHLVHNRPGAVCRDKASTIGVRWRPAALKDGSVFTEIREGRKRRTICLGTLGSDGIVRENGRPVGEYRKPGLYPEVAAALYRSVSALWSLDNEFAARFASWSFAQEQRDLKVVLAALMLVQSRSGEPVRSEQGETLFFDEDYRDVGEAMCLLRRTDKRDLHPKLLLRVGDLLALPAVAKINRELGFGKSARHPALGRWPRVVTKWLLHRERNPPLLDGLVRAGFRTTVMSLARRVGYKPESVRFFEALRWRQTQAPDGRRTMSLSVDLAPAESWTGLTEEEIVAKIAADRPGYKRLVGLLPKDPGLTPTIAAAAVASGALSDTDLVILTPTLEALGLLGPGPVAERWKAATATVQSLRAANIASRVKSHETAAVLSAASDRAVQEAMAEVTRDLRVYVFVDRSASMQGAIDRAKVYLTRFLQGFPLARLHVATFAAKGTEILLDEPSAAGIERAFANERAFGGTTYGAGVRALQHRRPLPGEDVIFLFVGDQEDGRGSFTAPVKASGLEPVAFGLLEVKGESQPRNRWSTRPKAGWRAVENTAAALGLPCFRIDEQMFSDSYGVTRVLRELIATAPVRARQGERVDLVGQILGTALLEKPHWA